MHDSFSISTILPAPAKQIYEAWLDAAQHSAMTGGKAEADPKIGGKFSAWDGYITGTTILMEPHTRIIQNWRTSEFPENAEDSLLEILIIETPQGTGLTINHSRIPEGQGKNYESGWQEHYFEPMLAYFEK